MESPQQTDVPEAATALDTTAIRRDFPLLERRVAGRGVVYLDSAATSLKPRAVIATITEFYERYTANVNRGVHLLSEEAGARFDEAREIVAGFIGADAREIVFVRNATEAVNLVAHSLPPDAPVLYTLGEHHSNFLPWQRRPNRDCIGLLADGGIDMDDLERKLTRLRPALLAVTHVSNAFGALSPIDAIVRAAHAEGTKVLVDASQSVPHRPVDVRSMDCDYLCFSGHKMCGPTGIGVLYGKRECLEALDPLHYGGDMISEVHEDDYVLRETPWRLEAGTPFIEGAIGLAAACEYLESVGLPAIHEHVTSLVAYGLERLAGVGRLTIYGPAKAEQRSGSITFTIDGLESHGVARMLSNRHNIFVRSGLHCAQPAHEALRIPPTVRASFYLYNNHSEVDQLTDALTGITANLTR